MGRTLNGMSNRLSRLLFGLMSANWANYFVAKTIRWRFFGWLLQGWLESLWPLATLPAILQTSRLQLISFFALHFFQLLSSRRDGFAALAPASPFYSRNFPKRGRETDPPWADIPCPSRSTNKIFWKKNLIRGHNPPKYDECHTRS